MTPDKTGAPTTVTRHDRQFNIEAGGAAAGRATFVEHDGRRIFLHTEVKSEFEGRGLATILITEALTATRADGLRIIAMCPMVAAYVAKRHDFDDIADPVTPEIKQWLAARGHH
jgi:predicted GNAT family acetyltransferase